MSFSVASYFTCSPRASSASATSASSPTAGAPHYCRYASQHWTQFHRRLNQKPPPLRNRTLFGAAPSVADRWPSSNDSQPHNSNSVLHRSWPRLHEVTRPHTALSARCRASRRSVSPLPPHTLFLPPAWAHFGHRLVFAQCAGYDSSSPDDSVNFYTPRSLHSICISPASAAPAASF